jgi:hypothetical protein
LLKWKLAGELEILPESAEVRTGYLRHVDEQVHLPGAVYSSMSARMAPSSSSVSLTRVS